MKKTLEWGILGCLFLVPFVPFVVAQSMFFPFITGKAFAFRFLVGIALALWGALVFYDCSYLPKKTPMLWAVLTFFGIVALADIFGVNFQRSMWSNFERMEGLVTFLYLCAFFVVSATVLTRAKKWPAFWNTSIIASCVMALYALFQVWGLTDISQGGARVDGTMGNSIYLAVYMLFHLFLTLWLLYEKRAVKPLTAFYVFALILQFFALYNTGTRGAMLGLLGGLGLTALLIAWRGKEHPRLRRASLGIIVGIVVLVGLVASIRNTNFVQNSEMLRRFTSISFTDGTVQSRLILWSGIAIDGFRERPVLGWGQDNFLVVFGKHYDPRMYKQEPWFDRAHNVFFDWLISAGLLGLLSYLALFGVALFVLWKRSAHLSVPERALGTGLLAGYFVHNIFVFDNLISYIFFLLFLGFVASTYAHEDDVAVSKKSSAPEPLITDATLRSATAVGVGVVVVVLMYMTTIPHINASQNIIRGIIEIQSGNADASLRAFDEAITDSVGRNEARQQLTRVAFTVASATDPRFTEDIKQRFLVRAFEESQKAALEDTESTRAEYFLATFYARTGNYAAAGQVYEKLLTINPDRQIFLSEYGLILELLGEKQKSEEVFARLFELSPEGDEAATRYTASLFAHGKRAEAQAVLSAYAGEVLGERTIDLVLYVRPTTFEEALKITTFEIMRLQYRRENVDAGRYVQAISDLANNGRRVEAFVLSEDLKVFFPDSGVQIEALQEAIRSGKTISITAPLEGEEAGQ